MKKKNSNINFFFLKNNNDITNFVKKKHNFNFTVT